MDACVECARAIVIYEPVLKFCCFLLSLGWGSCRLWRWNFPLKIHAVESQSTLWRLNLVIRLDWNQMLNKAHGTILFEWHQIHQLWERYSIWYQAFYMPACSIRTGWLPQLYRQSVLFLQPFFNHSPIRLWWGEWLLQDWDVCLLLLAALTRIVAGNSPSLLSCLTVW